MENSKYIVVVEESGSEHIIIFSEMLTHSTIADVFKSTGMKVVSAGFMTVGNDQANCFGSSESVGLKSRGQDDSNLADLALCLGVFKSKR